MIWLIKIKSFAFQSIYLKRSVLCNLPQRPEFGPDSDMRSLFIRFVARFMQRFNFLSRRLADNRPVWISMDPPPDFPERRIQKQHEPGISHDFLVFFSHGHAAAGGDDAMILFKISQKLRFQLPEIFFAMLLENLRNRFPYLPDNLFVHVVEGQFQQKA